MELLRPRSVRSTLYFTRLTVSEDGAYLPLPARTRAHFVQACYELPSIQELLRAYRECLGIDLLREMEAPYSERLDKRVLETGMYAAFAFFLEERWAVSPCAVAFYSSGVAPALIFSRALSVHDYLQKLAPFHSANRSAYATVQSSLPIAQTRLEASAEEDIERWLEEALANARELTRVYIKDRRHRHTALIAGERAQVERLRQMAAEAFPSIADKEPKLVETSSAHLPLYDRRSLERMLDRVTFGRPRVALIGIDGEAVRAETVDQSCLRSLVHTAAFGFMNTGRAIEEAARRSNRLIVVGSPFGARVLNRTHLGGYPRAELATDIVERNAV